MYHKSNLGKYEGIVSEFADLRGYVPEPGDSPGDMHFETETQKDYCVDPDAVAPPYPDWEELKANDALVSGGNEVWGTFVDDAYEATLRARWAVAKWRDDKLNFDVKTTVSGGEIEEVLIDDILVGGELAGYDKFQDKRIGAIERMYSGEDFRYAAEKVTSVIDEASYFGLVDEFEEFKDDVETAGEIMDAADESGVLQVGDVHDIMGRPIGAMNVEQAVSRKGLSQHAVELAALDRNWCDPPTV